MCLVVIVLFQYLVSKQSACGTLRQSLVKLPNCLARKAGHDNYCGTATTWTFVDQWANNELVVTSGHPGRFSVAGKYFGFANDNADSIFGPNWNGRTFAVTAGSKSGKIIVWRDNTNCLMSCGRWDPTSNAGDWSAGDTMRLLAPDDM